MLRFETYAPTVQVWRQTAVALFGFELVYEAEGTTHERVGREILVFERGPEGWLAVWRTLIFAS